MAVVIIILAFVLSLLPPILIFLWLRKRKAEDEEYRKICNKAFGRGALWCPLVLIVFLLVFYGLELLMTKLGVNAVVVALYHNFIVAALLEEGVKYAGLRRHLMKHQYQYSRLDVISMMMIIGIGFGLMEAVFFAAGLNPGKMIARGIMAMHCGYGFITGCFVAKGMQTGKKRYSVLGVLIPFVLHGLYDSCVSAELRQISEYISMVSVVLALVGIITLVVAIVHINKAKKKAEYTTPLSLFAQPSQPSQSNQPDIQ